MGTYTIRIKAKGKAWNGVESTEQANSVGQAIDQARVAFAQAHGELEFKAWELTGFKGDVVLVRPTGSWA